MHCHVMVYVRIVLTTLVTITCLLGDNFVDVTQNPLLKALFDNATHAVIGALTGIAFVVQFYDKTSNLFGWFLILICFGVSSLIDIDHFIEARSLNLEDATNLTQRPFLHCSSIIVILLAFFICTSCLQYFNVSLIMGSLLCAFITHHTRDAVRRGYWFYPIGNTERISHLGYVLVTICTPYLIGSMHCLCRRIPVHNFLAQYINLHEKYRIGSGGYLYMNI